MREPERPTPGWYSNADNKLQWWDGENWGPVAPENQGPGPTGKAEMSQSEAIVAGAVTDTPSPGPDTSQIEASEAKGNYLWGPILFTVVVVGVMAWLVFGLPGVGSKGLRGDDKSPETSEATSPPETAPAPAPPPAPVKTAADYLDDQLRAEGFSVAESGETYYRFFTDEEKAQSSCGYARCTWVVVHSNSGCAGGFYVKADLISGGTPVGWTNEISSSAQPGESVVVTLEDHQRSGEAFRLSEVKCMRR